MAATPITISSHLPTPYRSCTHPFTAASPVTPHLETREALSPPPSLHAELVARPVRRIIGPEQGRALDALSHAIEYLEDQMFFGVSTWSRREGDVAAIAFMRQRSREIYSGLPLRRSLWQRIQQRFAEAMHRHAQSATIAIPNSRVIPFPTS